MRKTKIVCTIGPVSRSPEVLARLIEAGMDVARLNFSHGAHSEHRKAIRSVRQLSHEARRPVAVLQDLAGQKIRVGSIEGGTVDLESGAVFVLTARPVPGDDREVSVNYPGLPQEVHPGDTLLLSDGDLELEVVETTKEDIRCRVIVGGPLASRKGITLPTRSLQAPSLTEKDREDLLVGMAEGVDYVALSFVRDAADVQEARKFMLEQGKDIPLIAKIEKHEALRNIDEIIEAVDGILVARGDLGVETPLEKVPRVQKMLIEKSNRAARPVITATQMLRSMVENPRPTRAEVTDVANAVLDGTDAVMLSEETAVGKYPVETVRMMSRIVEDAEAGFPYATWAQRLELDEEPDLTEAVARSACRLAEKIRARLILVFTISGRSARLVSMCRPRQSILASTPGEEVYRRLSLVWGVIPVQGEAVRHTDEMTEKVLKGSREAGLVESGDRVVLTAGVPVGTSGATNLIKVEVV